MKNRNQKNLNELKNNISAKNLIAKLVQKNLKGGSGCPPPIFDK